MPAHLLAALGEVSAFRTVSDDAGWQDPRVVRLRDDWLRANSNVHNGIKLGIKSAKFVEDAIEIVLVPTDWAAVQAVREGLQAGKLEHCSQLPLSLPIQFQYPNIAVVHCVVCSRDGRVLVTKRSTAVSYHPGAWSASFEEGIEGLDAESGERVFESAAKRGLIEECFTAVAPQLELDWFKCVAVGVESTMCNPFVVCRAELPYTSGSLLGMMYPSSAEVDSEGIRWLPADVGLRPHDILNLLPKGATLHPTAALRLAIAATVDHW